MSKRMTVEEWHTKNGGSNAINRDLQLALWDWQNDRAELAATAARRLALLRTCEKELLECPYCDAEAHLDGRYDESLIITHADDCELAKELSDDTTLGG